MLKRDIADDLYAMAIKRYRQEQPDLELTNSMMDSLWYSICGELNSNGYESAYQYVKTAKLSL